MKIAVIGGGTAGYMAAAHITKHFPQFNLYHIYDSSIPTIGVGEGTQAHFPAWLENITGLTFDELETQCNVTRKFGIMFENWGEKHPEFMHNFYPPKSAYGYHLSASNLVELLRAYVTAIQIDKKITAAISNGVEVKLEFSDSTQEYFDFVFDARGFPKTLTKNHYQVSLIPTNAALIRQGKKVNFNSATRTIARPFGWIFVIPLTNRTSYGYVYNSSLNSQDQIAVDLAEFLEQEQVEVIEEKHLTFPNFISRDFFDGALFKIGNKASFLEPLEATAIGLTNTQIVYASHYFLQDLAKTNRQSRQFELEKITVFNQHLFNITLKIALFISWHYRCGSIYNTEFWHFAKANFERELNKLEAQYVVQEFQRFLEKGASFNFGEYFSCSRSTFAGLTSSSFYEVGIGIGYY